MRLFDFDRTKVQTEAREKGQPVFAPGSGRRVFRWAIVFSLLMVLGILVNTILGPPVRQASEAIVGWVFNSKP